MKLIWAGMFLAIVFAYGVVSQYEEKETISFHQSKGIK